jgi:hypothetical protein
MFHGTDDRLKVVRECSCDDFIAKQTLGGGMKSARGIRCKYVQFSWLRPGLSRGMQDLSIRTCNIHFVRLLL